MKLTNPEGQSVYYNVVKKHGKYRFVVVAADEKTTILTRDRKRQKSRTFAQERQAEAYLARMGYQPI